MGGNLRHIMFESYSFILLGLYILYMLHRLYDYWRSRTTVEFDFFNFFHIKRKKQEDDIYAFV